MGADLFEPQAESLTGQTLAGRYEVLERLGVGGVGMVYRGRQAQLDRFVAIKVLHQDAAAVAEWRQRFDREAKALSALAHPNVVPISDYGVDRGVPYLVMELLQGRTLSDLIAEGPLPLWQALDIARQTLRGLAFAHDKGIVHRDLKPANVFLQALSDQEDHVRLLDFGMVKFLEGSGKRGMTDTLTNAGVAFGTPAYMSPEQIKGAPVDARTDVYAAGVLLFELLAGRRPFVSESQEGYLGAHLTEPIPLLQVVRPGLVAASSFQAVIRHAMAKIPEARFKDAGAMLAELEGVIARLPAGAVSGRRPQARKKKTSDAAGASTAGSRFRRSAIAVVAVATASVAVAAFLRHDRPKPVETAALQKPTPPKAAPPAESPPQPALPRPVPPAEALPKAPVPVETPPAPPPQAAAVPSPLPAAVQPPPPTAAQPPPPTAAQPPPPTAAQPPPPAAAPAPAAEEPAAIAAAPASGSAVRDPWQAAIPRALMPIRDRLDRGVRMSQRALAPAYTYAHENPEDPRPWLLLGHAYAQLDWFSDSVERYRRAHRIDPGSRGDPQMLADLLKGAAHPVAGRVAARAIGDIYGVEAMHALEESIEQRAGDPEVSARLARLREALLRQPRQDQHPM